MVGTGGGSTGTGGGGEGTGGGGDKMGWHGLSHEEHISQAIWSLPIALIVDIAEDEWVIKSSGNMRRIRKKVVGIFC